MPYLEPDLHGFKGRDGTSHDAAQAARAKSAARREAILDLLRGRPAGMTADEIAFALNLNILAIRPRVSELRNLGQVEPTGERRRNVSGAKAAVMRAVP